MIIAETALILVLAKVPVCRKAEDGEIQFSSNGDNSLVRVTVKPVESETQAAQNLEHALARDLATVPQVRHVLMESVNTVLLVWIAVDDPTREVRERIFQKELEVMDAFPEMSFDFNLVATRGRSIDEITTGADLVFSRN